MNERMHIENEFSIRNGDTVEQLDVDAHAVVNILTARATLAVSEPEIAVRNALDVPIGSQPLEELAQGARRVVIVADDMTRPTPTDILIPEILSRLNKAGVGDSKVTVLVANGTHREMTHEELLKKFGAEVVQRVRLVNHIYDDFPNLINLGNTPSGVPITVNRLVAESDLVIGVGNIVPHRYCGWAGGAKIIQPGVSGEATTAGTHLMITKYPDVTLGNTENTVRTEIEAVGDQVDLKFIVNTVLNADQQIAHVVAGGFRQAFRAGVERAKAVYGAPFTERTDIVVASSHPSDINLWQAGKAFYAAQLVAKPGGIIIVASPFTEGIGEHGEFAELMALDYQTITKLLDDDAVEDRIGAGAALACVLVREHAEIWLAGTGVTDAEAAGMRMRRYDTAKEALRAALAERPNATVSLISTATEVLPLQSTEN